MKDNYSELISDTPAKKGYFIEIVRHEVALCKHVNLNLHTNSGQAGEKTISTHLYKAQAFFVDWNPRTPGQWGPRSAGKSAA